MDPAVRRFSAVVACSADVSGVHITVTVIELDDSGKTDRRELGTFDGIRQALERLETMVEHWMHEVA